MKTKIFLLMALVFVSCTRTKVTQPAKSPEDTVRAFLSLSAMAKKMEDKKKLESLCMGEMQRAFERMTQEVFQLSYISAQVAIKKIEILSSQQKENTHQIHYRVEVENNSGTEPTVEVSEREVDLVQSDGKWLLQNIRPKGKDEIAFTRGMIF